MTEQGPPEEQQEDAEERRLRLAPPREFYRRRAPRYRAFGVTGGLIGLLAGLGLALANPADGDYSVRTIAGYLGVSLMLVGALFGLAVAVFTERRR